MNDDVIDFTSHVHDNMIQSYFVDFTNRTLKMDTCWEDKEDTTIEFTGLLAYKFENVLTSNIIFGLCQTSIQSFIEEEEENLLKSLKSCFPSSRARNCDELRKELEDERYKVFYLDSTLGLEGYVIAKDIRINSIPRQQ